MTKYRDSLPQLSNAFFLTDGGIETTLIFHEGLDLSHFAAFHLLKDKAGYEALRKYFRTYAALAKRYETGLVLESPTWRANPDWASKLGYGAEALAEANRKAIDLLCEIRAEFESEKTPMVISGCVGPRGDGYVPAETMSMQEAQEYHGAQIGTFSRTAADLVTAITMNYVEEAIGIVRAARAFEMPVVISFTVETDGKLPTGELTQPRHRKGGCGYRRRARILHDQLCASYALRTCACYGRTLAGKNSRAESQCLDPEPCSTQREHGTGRG